jgi:hypothetical protein
MNLNKLSFFGPLLSLLVSCSGNAAFSEQFDFVRSDEGILVSEAGQKVLFYQMAHKSLNGEYSRTNYIHPLYGPGGEILTEDFPEDHYHQRGIFWAWHQIYAGGRRLGDGWLLEDFDTPIIEASVDEEKVRLSTEVHWTSPRFTNEKGELRPFVEERMVLQFYPVEKGVRKLDFDLTFMALVDSVFIGGSEDEKGYGGFSARIKLPDGMVFTGNDGAVTPRNLQVDTGPWLDVTGPLGPDSTLSGVTILSHRSNPGHPQKWILRNKRSMQNIVYPGREPVALLKDRPLELRYRLLIHRGTLSIPQVDEFLEDFQAK